MKLWHMFINCYSVTGPVLNTLHIFTHFTLIVTPGGSFSSITHEETYKLLKDCAQWLRSRDASLQHDPEFCFKPSHCWHRLRAGLSLSTPWRLHMGKRDFRRNKPNWFPFILKFKSNSSKEGNDTLVFFSFFFFNLLAYLDFSFKPL